jgi:lysyl-tRNA synthetase, class II
MPELSEQEQIRRQSLQEIRNMGINPYPAAKYPVSHNAADTLANFDEQPEKFEGACYAGRLMSRRIMGKASFAELMDSSGRIQIYVNRDELCPGENKDLYNTLFKRLLDIGDIIGVVGDVFRTQTGEVTVKVKELTLLAKTVRPLPIVKEKDGVLYDAFSDPEQRYRQRYLDLIVNPHVREVFIKRSKIITVIREMLDSKGYYEVETPVLQPIHGGAAARPFVTTIILWISTSTLGSQMNFILNA